MLFEAARHLGWAERVRERREGRIELQYWVLIRPPRAVSHAVQPGSREVLVVVVASGREQLVHSFVLLIPLALCLLYFSSSSTPSPWCCTGRGIQSTRYSR